MAQGESIWRLASYGDQGYGDEMLHGLALTIEISICAYAIGLVFGLIGVGFKLHHWRALRVAGDGYTTIVRALPELLLLLLLYYTGVNAVRSALLSLGLVDESFSVSPFIAAVVALGFIQGAYQTEIFRGAIQSIPKGQIEAARAFGMSPAQRFIRIVFPQMIRFATPGMGNQWLNITKDSALISVLGDIPELLAAGLRAGESTRNKVFFLGLTGLLFLALTIVSMLILAKIERRAARGLAGPAGGR